MRNKVDQEKGKERERGREKKRERSSDGGRVLKADLYLLYGGVFTVAVLEVGEGKRLQTNTRRRYSRGKCEGGRMGVLETFHPGDGNGRWIFSFFHF